eukprot:13256238-Heterocapsa_arctica.AAC.1
MALKPSPNAQSIGQLRMDCSYLVKWLPDKDPYFVMPEEDIVRFYAHNNVPSEKDNVVTALPAEDDEEGAIE